MNAARNGHNAVWMEIGVLFRGMIAELALQPGVSMDELLLNAGRSSALLRSCLDNEYILMAVQGDTQRTFVGWESALAFAHYTNEDSPALSYYLVKASLMLGMARDRIEAADLTRWLRLYPGDIESMGYVVKGETRSTTLLFSAVTAYFSALVERGGGVLRMPVGL